MLIKILIFLFMVSSCSLFAGNDKTKEDVCDWPPGNRNYSWHIDTVAYFPSTLGGLHVINDSSVFLTGRINAKNGDDLHGLQWDGSEWTREIYSSAPDYPIGHYGLDATGDDSIMVSVGYWDLNGGFKSAIGEFNLRTKTWTKYQYETIGRLNSVWTDGKGFYVAVGDNGVMYTKESPNSNWEFSRMEDGFNLIEVSGISSSELYISSYKGIIGNPTNYKLYRYLDDTWITLYDTRQSEANYLSLNSSSQITRVKAFRCLNTDSLYLFIPGESTFKVSSYSNELSFNEVDLKSFNSTLMDNINSGWVFGSNPNDIWTPTMYYGIYHYDGSTIQKMESIPQLPYGDTAHWGIMNQMVFSASGKIWMLIESKVQNYILIQGTPL